MRGRTSYSTKRTATSAEAAAIHVSRRTWWRPPTLKIPKMSSKQPLCPHTPGPDIRRLTGQYPALKLWE